MNSGKILLGVLAGVAVGALAGILFAPEKGSTTRRNIMNKGEDVLDELKDKFDELVATVTDKFETTKKDAEELVQGQAFNRGVKKEV